MMARQIINIGNVPDDGKGDKLRVAFEKVNANFAELYAGAGGGGSFTISVAAAPAAGGSVAGGGTFAAGTSQTVTATANSGYTFVNWTNSGTVVSTSAAYTFTLTTNTNLVANFATGLFNGAIGYWVMSDYAASPNPVVANRLAAHPPNLNLLRWGRYVGTLGYTILNTVVTLNAADGPLGPAGNLTATLLAGTGLWEVALTPDMAISGTYTVGFHYKRGVGSDQQFKFFDATGSATTGTLTATASWQRGSLTFTGLPTSRPAFASFDLATSGSILVDNVEMYAGASDLGPVTHYDGHLYLGATGLAASPKPTFTSGYLNFSAANLITEMKFDGSTSSNQMTAIVIFQRTGTATYDVLLGKKSYPDCNLASQWSGARFSCFGGVQTGSAIDNGMVDLSTLGWQAVGMRVNATALDHFLSNSISRRTLGTPSSETFDDFMIGFVPNQFTLSDGNIASMVLFPTALSDAQYQSVLSGMVSDISANVTVPATKRFLMSEGDSITQGYGTTNGGYPNLYVPTSSPKLTGVNYSVVGNILGDIQARSAALNEDLAVANKRPGDKYIFTIMVGTNDIVIGYTGGSQAAFLSSYAAFLDAKRAAGWYVIVCTIISGTHPAAGGIALSDAVIAPINTAIRTWAGVHADAVCDFAGNAAFGAGGSSNATYYQSDNTHPTDAGQSLLASIIAPIINAA